jgi:hypothetical protein
MASMRRSLGYHLYAWGRAGMPREVNVKGTTYFRKRIFKHDFFAATGMYERNGSPVSEGFPRKIVLKLGREQNFFGMPMRWLGRATTERELDNLRRVGGIAGVPKLVTRYGLTGFAYEYIEGRSLDDRSDIPEGFFDRLRELLDQVHRRNVVYLDMNKRGNIIIGEEGQPYLVDFQISVHISNEAMAAVRLLEGVLKSLQDCDIYHLYKHKRKLCPQELRPEEEILSYRISRYIQLHTRVTRPLTKLRRALLKKLFANRFLVRDTDIHYSPENDPARFLK